MRGSRAERRARLTLSWVGALSLATACRPEAAPGAADTASDTACEALSFFPDTDGDGHGDPAGEVQACRRPPGHVDMGDDCDDADGERYPGAPERCDGADQDCDSQVDEEAVDALTWYVDADGDGFGGERGGVETCPEAPWSALDGDCADTDPAIHPEAEDRCGTGVDEDCDGEPGPGCVFEGEVDPEAGTWWTGAEEAGTAGQALALLPLGEGVLVGADGPGGPGRGWLLDSSALARDGEDLGSVATWSFSGDSDRTGGAVASADLDGDGFSDVILGAWGASPGGLEAAGAAYVVFGPLSGEDDVESASTELRGWAEGAGASWSVVAVAGDDTGGPALLLGGLATAAEPVAAVLFDGLPTGSVGPDEARLSLVGEAPEAPGDPAVVGAADLDGDGLMDLILAREEESGGGRVHRLPGDRVASALPGEALSLAELPALLGPAGSRLGASLGATDLDGDGRDDLVLGAPGADAVWGVAALYGWEDGEADVEARALWRLDGPVGSALGSSQCGGLGRDGRSHLVLGAPTADTDRGETSGAAWILALPVEDGVGALPNAALGTLAGRSASDRAGGSVACGEDLASDLDGDGLGELLLGAPFDADAGNAAGAVGWFAFAGP